MSAIDTAHARIAALLADAGVPAEADASGGFSVPHGPTTVHLALSETDGRPVLEIWAPILPEATLTPALFRYAAETSFLFGRLCVARTGDATGQLQISHALLADPIDEVILISVLGTIANTAADLASTLAADFPPPGT